MDIRLQKENEQCNEYTERIGFRALVEKATRQYAEWSAVAECRMLSMRNMNKANATTNRSHLVLRKYDAEMMHFGCGLISG